MDVESYDKGLYAALREDPDVILIGEMRDPATIETALMAAETGHLVFSTIHTNSAIDSIDRIVGVFPEDKQPQDPDAALDDAAGGAVTAAGAEGGWPGQGGSL